MHAEVMRHLPIYDIIVCFYAHADNCSYPSRSPA
jgi:hypothetical protein